MVAKTYKIISIDMKDQSDLKKFIYVDESCVSQVLLELPDEVFISHACELYKYLIQYKNIRIKSRTVLFLLLLLGTDNISKALNIMREKPSETMYQIICCNTEKGHVNKSFKLNKKLRELLSENTIHSLEWLS
ncbi:hypothetical protein SUSAZ_03020 [Sulfolobus acidocaldarius SUSAZ]|nr:hypothetical protein SUSAZ_03020 [Sulfolobus acidocaldarius SUSAZ]